MTKRLPSFDINEASTDQKMVFEEILLGQLGQRGNLDDPFLTWIHSPKLASHVQGLGEFCRYSTGLPVRLSQLAILITSARWLSQAQWHVYYPIAIDAGISKSVAESIRSGKTPAFDNDDDALVYGIITQLYDSFRVSDRLYDSAVLRWGHEVVVNFIGLLGYHALVAMTNNVFGVRAHGQIVSPFLEPRSSKIHRIEG